MMSRPVVGDISQALLNDDDECKVLAGPEAADDEAAVIEQDAQATDGDLVRQLVAENVRTPLVILFCCGFWRQPLPCHS